MSDRLRVAIEDGVADVRLNRPDKRNALDVAMFLALAETGAALADDRSVRCVVLSGEGASFCAGIDTSLFMGGGAGEPSVNLLAREGDGAANAAQNAAYVWHAMPQPVLAAVHGHAFGGGFQIAVAADIRFVANDAKLSAMEIKWGIVPDMTGTQLLPKLVGPSVAKELAWTGRVISGVDAYELGIATHVSDDPYLDAMTLAREIAGKNPDAVRGIKQLVDACGEVSIAEGLMLEEQVQRGLLGTPNHVEAIQANMEGRPPRFQ